jgi:hypothetical protein
MQDQQRHDNERLCWSEVARGGVEPPTFRFSVPSPPDRLRPTVHVNEGGLLIDHVGCVGPTKGAGHLHLHGQ